MANELKTTTGVQLPATVSDFRPDAIVVQYSGIPSFESANGDARAIMEEAYKSLDPMNYDSIIDFGQAPAETLAESAREIIVRAERAGVLSRGFQSFAARAQDFDIAELGDMAARYVGKGQKILWANKGKALMATALMPFFGIPVAGAALGAMVGYEKIQKMRKGGQPVTAEELQTAINSSLLQMDDIMSELAHADEEAPELARDINRFRTARLQNVNELGQYIAAGTARLKYARDVELPEMNAQIDAARKNGGDALLEAKRDDFVMGLMNINIRLTRLYTSFTAGLYTVSQLRDLENSITLVQAKVREHTTNSKAQWEALIADAALSSQTHDLFKAVEKADAFGDNIFDQAAKLRSITREGLKESITRGALDPQKVINAINDEAKYVRENAKAFMELNTRMTGYQKALADGAKNLEAAYRDVNQAIYSTTTLGDEPAKGRRKAVTAAPAPKAIEAQPAVTVTPVFTAQAEPVAVPVEAPKAEAPKPRRTRAPKPTQS